MYMGVHIDIYIYMYRCVHTFVCMHLHVCYIYSKGSYTCAHVRILVSVHMLVRCTSLPAWRVGATMIVLSLASCLCIGETAADRTSTTYGCGSCAAWMPLLLYDVPAERQDKRATAQVCSLCALWWAALATCTV